MKILKINPSKCDDCTGRKNVGRICEELQPLLMEQVKQYGHLRYSDDGLGNGAIAHLVECCPQHAFEISDEE